MSGVIALGECMIELSLTGDARAAIGYAGDTFNTAVYLARLGHRVSYATAIGAGDPFSAGILRVMAAESMDPGLVTQVHGRLPGLYAIERDPSGERRFFYWRDQAPVRQLFQFADIGKLKAAALEAELVYLSGITMAVLGDEGRAELLLLLGELKAAGVAIAFDPNYRPRLWESPQTARDALEALVPLCRYLSFSGPDLADLYDRPVAQVAAGWAQAGCEVVARDEDQTVTVLGEGGPVTLPPEPPVHALDTTGAGDSFNAGYLAARLEGFTPAAAVARGRRLARIVVQHLGAIIPKGAMPDV